jgi:uncharacterized lipoprotein YajG
MKIFAILCCLSLLAACSSYREVITLKPNETYEIKVDYMSAFVTRLNSRDNENVTATMLKDAGKTIIATFQVRNTWRKKMAIQVDSEHYLLLVNKGTEKVKVVISPQKITKSIFYKD